MSVTTIGDAIASLGRNWEGKTPPTFHEIRSLSERLYSSLSSVCGRPKISAISTAAHNPMTTYLTCRGHGCVPHSSGPAALVCPGWSRLRMSASHVHGFCIRSPAHLEMGWTPIPRKTQAAP